MGVEDGVRDWNEAETTLSFPQSTQENIGLYSWACCQWDFLCMEFLRHLITAK